MDTAPEEDRLKRLEITEIFHSTTAPIVELPAMRALLEASVQDCPAVLRDSFGLDGEVALERTVQQPSYEALGPCSGMIGAVHDRFPGFRFKLINQPDGHSDYVRFAWGLGPEGQETVIEGSDIVETRSGRIDRVVGFLDKLPAA